MSSSAILLISSIGVGAIAGFTLDRLGLIVLVVMPSILVAILCRTIVGEQIAWYIYPIGWIAQQAAYLTVLMAGRPIIVLHKRGA